MKHHHLAGLSRKEFLQVGFSGLVGLGMTDVLRSRATAKVASATKGKAKSVILVFQTGAPAHQDTFDLKPNAPDTVRGEYKPIATSVPGIQYGEHIPKLAKIADKFAVVRSMTHAIPGHEFGTHFVLTGIDKQPPQTTHMASRNDWPCYSAGLQYFRPRADGLPCGVMLPTYLNNGYGFCGQNGGLLGSHLDPWHITKDPNRKDFQVDELSLLPGLTINRLNGRRALLNDLDAQRRRLAETASVRKLTGSQRQAYNLLCANARFRQAFEMDREPKSVRDRYGRHLFGQSLLLSRRLVEAGMPVIQANMGRMNHWDTHVQNFKRMRQHLLPPFDTALSVLLTDLEERGLLDTTLVIAVGEFGRTPKINKNAGRDHWSGVFSALFAGAGVRGGQVIGASDKTAAYPATRGYHPSDLGATIYAALGIDPGSKVMDRLGRPHRLNAGKVISELYQ